MAYYIMFLWIPRRDGTRSKIAKKFLVNALHAFHRFNRRYHVKKLHLIIVTYCNIYFVFKETGYKIFSVSLECELPMAEPLHT